MKIITMIDKLLWILFPGIRSSKAENKCMCVSARQSLGCEYISVDLSITLWQEVSTSFLVVESGGRTWQEWVDRP